MTIINANVSRIEADTKAEVSANMPDPNMIGFSHAENVIVCKKSDTEEFYVGNSSADGLLSDSVAESLSGTATTQAESNTESVNKDKDQDSQIAQLDDAIQALASASMAIHSITPFDLVGHTSEATALRWGFTIEVASNNTDILDANDTLDYVIYKNQDRRYHTDGDFFATNTKNSDSVFKVQAFLQADDSPLGDAIEITVPRDVTDFPRHVTDIIDSPADDFEWYFAVWSENDSAYLNIGHVDVTINSGAGAVSSGYSLIDTGFLSDKININYDPTARTITLTDGTEAVSAIFKGAGVSAITSGWVSDPHSSTLNSSYFLYYNGTNFVWEATAWEFSDLQIAEVVYYDNMKFAVRECHGLMEFSTHQELHFLMGTWKKSGGAISNYAENSTVPTDQRPTLGSTVIVDEDVETSNASSSTGNYARFKLSTGGAPATALDQDDILTVGGNGRPLYNEYTGGDWTDTQMSKNHYGKIFLVNIPVAADSGSQKYRTLYLQSQVATNSLIVARAFSTADYDWGAISGGVIQEFVFVGEIIVQATNDNWEIVEVNTISGSRQNQTSSPSTAVPSLEQTIAVDGEVNLDGYAVPDRVMTFVKNAINTFTVWGDGKVAIAVAEIATLTTNIITSVTGTITTLTSTNISAGSPSNTDAVINVGAGTAIAESYNSDSTDPSDTFDVANYIEDTVTGELFAGYKTWKDPLSNKRLRVVPSFNGGPAFSWALTNEAAPTANSVIHQDASDSYFQASANLADNTTGSYSGAGTYAGYQAGVGYTPAQSGESIRAEGQIIGDSFVTNGNTVVPASGTLIDNCPLKYDLATDSITRAERSFYGDLSGINDSIRASVADGSYLDLNLMNTGTYMGTLNISAVLEANALVSTSVSYILSGRGTVYTTSVLHTRNGTSGALAYTLSVPSAGVIRVTSNVGSALITDIAISFNGHLSL